MLTARRLGLARRQIVAMRIMEYSVAIGQQMAPWGQNRPSSDQAKDFCLAPKSRRSVAIGPIRAGRSRHWIKMKDRKRPATEPL
jgi:hypothetical protein